MKFLAVKGFEKFQHYRDRNPPWIKLHGTLLTDLAFLELSEAAQAQLVKLWVLASQLGHPLPNNPKLLAGKIGTTGKFHLASIIAAGFLIPCNDLASSALAESSENARPSVCARIQSSEIELEAVVDEPTLTALWLTIWANGAITERWGEQPAPLTQSGAVELADELRALGAGWRVVRDSIYGQCRRMKALRPPRSVNYFRPGVIEDLEREASRLALAESGPQSPPLETTRRQPPGGGERPSIGKRAFDTTLAAIEDL
jgi:hypothetical protein